jgi:hypothetical protein
MSPPMVELVWPASSSVALPRSPESGIIANALMVKITSGDACMSSAAIAIGTKTSRVKTYFTRARVELFRLPSEGEAQGNVRGGLACLFGPSAEGPRDIEGQPAGDETEPDRLLRSVWVIRDITPAKMH